MSRVTMIYKNIEAFTLVSVTYKPVTGEFPPHKGQWRGALSFFVDLRPNKRLSNQT